MGNPILDEAIGALARARSLEEVQETVRVAARRLVDANGATFVLMDEGTCFYADEDAVSPLWKGQRFPINQCISGWAMLNRKSAVIPDIRHDERIPQEVYAPTFVRSLAMVPVGADEPVGAIGAYWSRVRVASDAEVARLEELATATAAALRRLAPAAYRSR